MKYEAVTRRSSLSDKQDTRNFLYAPKIARFELTLQKTFLIWENIFYDTVTDFSPSVSKIQFLAAVFWLSQSLEEPRIFVTISFSLCCISHGVGCKKISDAFLKEQQMLFFCSALRGNGNINIKFMPYSFGDGPKKERKTKFSLQMVILHPYTQKVIHIYIFLSFRNCHN